MSAKLGQNFTTQDKSALFYNMNENQLNQLSGVNQTEKDCVLGEIRKNGQVGAFDAYYKCVCRGKSSCKFYNLFPALTNTVKNYVSTNQAAKDKFVYYDRNTANYFSYSDACWKKTYDFTKNR